MTMSTSLAEALGRELHTELSDALARIGHCLEQLTDEQVWHRPAEGMYSIANLLLHLAGNIRQWLVAGLGGTQDTRDRPAEFAARGGVARAHLWADLQTAVAEAGAVLVAQSDADWLRVRGVQGFEVTGVGAAVNSVAHFRGHTQEIVHQTRALLGPRYRFAWVPASKEQGAAV
jgi:hypothetical protein